MVRPSGWEVLGLDGDPTPGVVEAVQALAKEFGDFSHDVQRAWSSLNSFGADTNALSWIGQSADAFKQNFGPLPGRLQKLYISYGEASDALSAYWPKLQAAQNKADTALRQGQDAEADLARATGHANNAAADLKSAQAGTDPKATADAQSAHDAAQKNLNDAKSRLAALAAAAQQAREDLKAAAKECAKALHHAQSDGIHNKHWWQHVGTVLSEVGGKIAEWAGEAGQIAAVLAPVLDGLALLTVEIPGLDVVTASLAVADDLIAATATTGLAIQATGDGLQGHWGDLATDALYLGASRMGGKSKGEEPGEDAVPPGAVAAQEGPQALPPGNGGITLSQARRARGKPGAAGEDYVRAKEGGGQTRHYPVPVTTDPNAEYPVTRKGGRHVDVPVDLPNGDTLAIEVKTYQQYRTVSLPDGTNTVVKGEVPLSAEIREQINKDLALRDADPHYDPRWEFVGAGPSQELRDYLTAAKIIFVEHR